MPRIISVHSFCCGTGKTNLTANLAVLLAGHGQRVGLLDADLRSPGLHILFGLKDMAACSFNDYLWGHCPIEQAARDVTPPNLPPSARLFLVPSSNNVAEITRLCRQPYDSQMLSSSPHRLIEVLALDSLIADVHAGLHEEALLQVAVSDMLIIVMRLDQHDYKGTAILLDLAQRAGVPQIELIINQVPPAFDATRVQARIEQLYQRPVLAVLHHSQDMLALGSAGLFVLRYPFHPLTTRLEHIAHRLAD